MDDLWEQTRFGDLTHDGLADSDGDGQTDLLEFMAGTNPTDQDSVFVGTGLTPSNGGAVTLRWASVPGKKYQIQYKDDLNQFTWNTLLPAVTASGPESEITDNTAINTLQRYYRIISIR
jgi:hypothetical protein